MSLLQILMKIVAVYCVENGEIRNKIEKRSWGFIFQNKIKKLRQITVSNRWLNVDCNVLGNRTHFYTRLEFKLVINQSICK